MSMSSSSSSSSSSSTSLRPIAPHMDVYAAACNPPRRAKRARPDDAPASHDEEGDDDDDEEQQQPPSHPPPKRRGRRPGTLSRAAREAQRKINHSLIEKARRTKINDALATLRELVPPEYRRSSESNHNDDSDDDDLDSRKRKSKPPAEKEFKLEILVRTVAYLQDLTDKVKQLEHDGCPRCHELISLTPKSSPSSRDSSVPSRSRLPSISAWLPDDQRTLLTPSHSPVFDTTTTTTTRQTQQLPTPPTSATCPPATAGFQIPPVLTLPSPSTFLPPTTTTAAASTPHILPRFSGFIPRKKPSPIASPVYTPDDETAASLLLRISTTSPRARRQVDPDPKLTTSTALTPSRLLGLNAAR